jgi:hypothetical protein
MGARGEGCARGRSSVQGILANVPNDAVMAVTSRSSAYVFCPSEAWEPSSTNLGCNLVLADRIPGEGPGRGRLANLPPATCCAPEAVFTVMEPPPNAELERLLNGGHSALGRGFEGFGA